VAKPDKRGDPTGLQVTHHLRLPVGQAVDLGGIDPSSTPGFDGNKAAGEQAVARLGPRLAGLQEKLLAQGRSGLDRSVLLVLQGMDTAGKGGTVTHVLGQVDPMGVHYKGFKAPTLQERRHDFLWRIRRELPTPGLIGVFDRSHYEDVVTTRVHGLVDRRTWQRRYGIINRFEQEIAAEGTKIVKCFLHISMQEQRRRLLARLADPTKRWKYDPHDVDERAKWSDYQLAYSEALQRTNTVVAPWHVIPADRKWWRNLAVTCLLIEALEGMSLRYPRPAYDVKHEVGRLQ
jgi:PPK2 family polyphosphate:nucleotide phosphotransferase